MTGREFDVLVVGSLNMDLVVTLDRAPAAGETVLGHPLHTYPGGKGANQAVAAARLGARTAMVGRTGTDAYGEALRGNLAAAGVNVDGVRPLPDAGTGTAVIWVEGGGENRIVVIPGANARLHPADLDPGLFARARVVLVSQEVPADTVAAALLLGRRAGCTTVLNPAPARPVAPAALAGVDVLTPNRTEAGVLSGRPVATAADARAAAAALLRQGAGAVVLTLGGQGALALWPGGHAAIPAFPVTPVDTTAAGDAFCGGLAAALARGEALPAAARYGAAAAAIAVTRPGAQPSLPTAAEVAGFLARQG